MADAGPNWAVERVRLQAQIDDHDDTIAMGNARLEAIVRQKAANQRRADLQNLDLDTEAGNVRENTAALEAKKADIRTNLAAMTKKEKGD